ncbi:MAG: glycosyltransferase [Deltaproteobacteria bacterium]|nr:MAG: glycosyltransferase [Deltaproteobacteria bacterium]RLB84168.1 MAG: glycosyltransferase [Deltaproteobacteria bacterium]
MGNFIRELASRGQAVDLIRIRGHGPYLAEELPNVRPITLPTSHVNSALFPLVRYLRMERPEVLLSDKDRVNRVALLARRISGVNTRIVIRVGTTVSLNLARRGFIHRHLQYLSIKHLYPWSDCIILPSKGAAQDLERIAPHLSKKIKVTPSPVASPELELLSRQVPVHPWLTDRQEPIILGVGELCGRKNFSCLIRAFALVNNKVPSRLIILGEGRQRAHLQHLAGELGIADRISLPGFVSNPYAFMARASVFVLSSLCEGAPVVLMEALALGIPVVSTDCPSGPAEILEGGKIAPLVPIGDPATMAQAILSVLDKPPDPELLRSASMPFTVKKATDCYLQTIGLLS